jgi:hypothetical protein
MAAKKKPAITGLHSQGIVDDIIKIGVKGVRAAVRTTKANKKFAKKIPAVPTTRKKDAFGMYETTKQKMKNQGALSYKENIAGLSKAKAKATPAYAKRKPNKDGVSYHFEPRAKTAHAKPSVREEKPMFAKRKPNKDGISYRFEPRVAPKRSKPKGK